VTRLYKVQEIAELAGVTVRALHHYDRLGLLKPRRADTGYRLYRQIATLLDRDPLSLHDALRRQRRVLEEKRRLLDSAIRAIGEAGKATELGRHPARRHKLDDEILQ
jgi:MerR family transcriptional regulator, thiopeptide resistance regulator